MNAAIPTLLTVVMVCAAFALLGGLVWWALTWRAGAGGGARQRMPCGFRRDHDDSWSVGQLSFEQDRLVHRGPGGLFAFKQRHWDRSGLSVALGSTIDGGEVSARLRGVTMVSIPCRYDGDTFELAVTAGRYTALRSWVEASPPGWNANVA